MTMTSMRSIRRAVVVRSGSGAGLGTVNEEAVLLLHGGSGLRHSSRPCGSSVECQDPVDSGALGKRSVVDSSHVVEASLSMSRWRSGGAPTKSRRRAAAIGQAE